MIDDLINEVSDTNKFSYNKNDYIKKKKEQLNWAYKVIDGAIEELKSNPSFFIDYVNMQSKFDMYTPRNALLVLKQSPSAMQLKERKEWIESNVSFRQVIPKKIIVIEPGKPYTLNNGKSITPYNAKELIDVSETNSKPNIKNYDKKLILQALIRTSPIKIQAIDKLDNGRMCEWNQDDQVIYVCKNENCDFLIGEIVTEIARISLFQETNEIDEDRINCIAYMVCKKFDVEKHFENYENFSLRYSNLNSKEIIKDLTTMKKIAFSINVNILNYLNDKMRELKKREQERQQDER